MKKLMFCITLTLGLALQVAYTNAQTIDPAVIKSDPDWQTIARIEGSFVDRLVAAKIDLANFDLNNEKLVLSTTGMTRDEYLKNGELVKAAASSLVKRYAMDITNCPSCSVDNDTRNEMFRSVIAKFKANQDIYSRFKSGSLGLDGGTNRIESGSCCGIRFYLCVFACSVSLELFPAYLACCATCYNGFCCNN